MPIWRVKTTWLEDETEATEQWEVNAETEQAAVEQVSKHVRFRPHHVEVSQRRMDADDETALMLGQVRRIAP